LVVGAAFETEQGDMISMGGDDAFLDLQGGGTHAGIMDDGSSSSLGVNLGGTHVFLPSSEIRFGESDIGVYAGAEVTFGGAQTVATDINSAGEVTIDGLVNIRTYANHGTLTVNDGKLLWLNSYDQY